MDKEKPFVGEQSPRITLDATTPHGIKQVRARAGQGQAYTGRIWLRGTLGARVKVALIWGPGAERPRKRSHSPSPQPMRSTRSTFTAKADAGDALFEIAGTGKG